MDAIETIEHWLNCSRAHDGSVADTAAAIVRGLEDSGFAIVPKQLPESTIRAGNLDAEDSDQYEVLVEHCRVKL